MPPIYRNVKGIRAYRVGDDGSVWSYLAWRTHPAGKWRQLTAVVGDKYGHLKVTLCQGARKFHAYVHTLVLEHFIGPCPDGMECRHLDGNPRNNRLENLKWGTRQENAADTQRHGRHFTPFAKPPMLAPEIIAELQRRGDSGETTRALAQVFGVSKSTAHLIVARKGAYSKGA